RKTTAASRAFASLSEKGSVGAAGPLFWGYKHLLLFGPVPGNRTPLHCVRHIEAMGEDPYENESRHCGDNASRNLCPADRPGRRPDEPAEKAHSGVQQS